MEELLKYESVISAFMPLVVIILTGLWVNNRLEKLKSRLQLDHAIIQKRADIYAEIQEDINNIYSYIKRVGKWKEFTPENILKAKRRSDQKFHITRPYWSKATIKNYHKLMGVCFETYRGHGEDAGIIAQVEKYKTLVNWDDSFCGSFAKGYDQKNLEKSYAEFMASLSKDFGIV